MHSSSGNIKFTPYSDANVIDKLCKSLRSRYQENLETSMKGSQERSKGTSSVALEVLIIKSEIDL